jgi:hypothetical protein
MIQLLACRITGGFRPGLPWNRLVTSPGPARPTPGAATRAVRPAAPPQPPGRCRYRLTAPAAPGSERPSRTPAAGLWLRETKPEAEPAQDREEPQRGRARSGDDECDGNGGREQQEHADWLGDHQDRQGSR